MKLKLYRGITLNENDVERVVSDIKQNGITRSSEASYGQYCDLKEQISDLFLKSDLSRNDTHPEINRPNDYTHGELVNPIDIMYFTDLIGAEYFAKVHHKTDIKNIPVMIEIVDEIDNVIIDGRDFLYPCFQFIEHSDIKKQKNQINKIVDIFGNSIKKYLVKAANNTDFSYRIALCDLATQDHDVIKDFYKNTNIIEGRFGTTFKYYFGVKVPISAEKVISVKILDNTKFYEIPKITLKDILNS